MTEPSQTGQTSKPLLLALYWDERAATPEVAAEQLLPVFAALQRQGLDRFRRTARSRKAAEAAVFVPDLRSVAAQFAAGGNRRDADGIPMPELGYGFSLWSGGPEDQAFSLTVHAGSSSPYARNLFLLRLPANGAYALQQQPQRVLALFAELAALLEPTQGVVCDPQAIAWSGRELSRDIPAWVRLPA